MTKTCTLQIFIDGRWQDAATVELTGGEQPGVEASTYLAYLSSYALEYWERADAAALSVNVPVDLAADAQPAWPPFLVDLLPQGYGRGELLKQLDRSENAGSGADWDLLCAGAGNPIGNLRVKEAHAWAAARTPEPRIGFTMEQVASRAGDFNEYLAQNGLFLAGSSGVQGEWPKILLTQADDDLFYLDHTLPDALAKAHFIVKFGRGTDESMASILRLEAPYMALAKSLGLKVFGELTLRRRALFIPRFDREIADGKVVRHGQESVASLCGLGGFGKVPSHNTVCRRLKEVAADPVADVIEYIRRDIANVALGNKDNHARNTAIQRRSDGTVSLTPLFDFAPMWLHPEGIARRIRWEADDDGSPDWASVIRQACESAAIDEQIVRTAVKQMAAPMAALIGNAADLGIAGEFLQPLERTVGNIRQQLEDL
ncbi:type II toxin-antitoxin system HipA family toxin [Herbaspirillum sp. RV1423]|uniref:type II toxin-antitoxin system HipA family toxin n=1 Tax=Herbaspirillum sp. RV1423 TaxID=1443993 RepID=UPI0004B36C6D|nr:HipA domain-containing protein [Herbaspirillum sp. RV1423]